MSMVESHEPDWGISKRVDPVTRRDNLPHLATAGHDPLAASKALCVCDALGGGIHDAASTASGAELRTVLSPRHLGQAHVVKIMTRLPRS